MLVPWNDGARLVAGFRTALSEFVCVGVSLRMQNKLQATRRWLWILKSRSAASPAAIETSPVRRRRRRPWRWQRPQKTKDSGNKLARSLAGGIFGQFEDTFTAIVNFAILFFCLCFCLCSFFLFPTEIESAGNDLQIQFKFGPFRHASFTWHACKFVQK